MILARKGFTSNYRCVLLLILCVLAPGGGCERTQAKVALGPEIKGPHVERVDRYVSPSATAEDRDEAGLRDCVVVRVHGLSAWLQTQKKSNGAAPTKNDVVLVIDGVELTGLPPDGWMPVPGSEDTVDLRYFLVYTSDSEKAWVKIIRVSPRKHPITVTVGIQGGERLQTRALALDAEDKPIGFRFIAMPIPLLVGGLLGVSLALVLFIWLAHATEIIRDVNAARRPDGSAPFSLARLQAAFWFFAVITAFLFLWIVTGSIETIPPTVLGLTAISAGTALTAVVADNVFDPNRGAAPGKNFPAVNLAQPRAKIKSDLLALQSSLKTDLDAKLKAQGDNTLSEADRQKNATDAAELKSELDLLEKQIAYFERPPRKAIKSFFLDLITEGNAVSFSRFQMLVWTLAVGAIFGLRRTRIWPCPTSTPRSWASSG